MQPTIWLTAACLGLSACSSDRTTLAPSATTAPAAGSDVAHLFLDKVP